MNIQKVVVRAAYVVTLGLLAAQVLQSAVLQSQQARLPNSPDPAFARVEDDPRLPRVLLIGDSISVGYTIPTRELLEGKANVQRIPVNGGSTKRGLENLEKWVAGKWDIIHFNWGLHDVRGQPDGKVQVSLEDYEANLQELVKRLKKSGAKLIWATTTPVPEGNLEPPRKNSDVLAYNAAAKKIIEEHKLEVNDLYSCVFPQLEQLGIPADAHFTDEGYRILGKQVASRILEVLNSPEK